jgi:hypothetical protein
VCLQTKAGTQCSNIGHGSLRFFGQVFNQCSFCQQSVIGGRSLRAGGLCQRFRIQRPDRDRLGFQGTGQLIHHELG